MIGDLVELSGWIWEKIRSCLGCGCLTLIVLIVCGLLLTLVVHNRGEQIQPHSIAQSDSVPVVSTQPPQAPAATQQPVPQQPTAVPVQSACPQFGNVSTNPMDDGGCKLPLQGPVHLIVPSGWWVLFPAPEGGSATTCGSEGQELTISVASFYRGRPVSPPCP